MSKVKSTSKGFGTHRAKEYTIFPSVDSTNLLKPAGDYNYYSKGSMQFNGTPSYVANFGRNDTFSGVGKSFTFEAWIKPFAISTNAGTLFSCRGGTNGGWFVFTGGSGGPTPGKIVIGPGGGDLTSTITPNLNEWIHVAVSYQYIGSNNNILKLYLNGQLNNSKTQNDIIVPTPNPGSDASVGFELGDPTGYSFQGLMDEVRFWDYLRTDAEIADNYRKTIAGTAPGLLVNLRFEELGGNPVNLANGVPAVAGSTTWSYDTPVLDQRQALSLIVPTLDPDTYNYYQNVIRNGGDVSFLTLQALDEFVRNLKSENLWDKIYDIGPLCGNNVSAAMTKLKSRNGVWYLTPANVDNSNYVERGASAGVKGNGSSVYMDTGYTGDLVTADGHMACYFKGTEANGASKCVMGASVAGDTYGNYLGWINGGTWEVGGILTNGNDYTPYGNTVKQEGAVMVSHFGAISTYYSNGLVLGSPKTIVDAYTPLSVPIQIMCVLTQGGSRGLFATRYVRYYSLGRGFSDTEAATYQKLITTLQSRLHRTA